MIFYQAKNESESLEKGCRLFPAEMDWEVNYLFVCVARQEAGKERTI